jgi:hypothetical protein
MTVKYNRAVIQLVTLALVTLGVASHPAEAVFDPTIAVETLYTSDIHFGQGDGEDVSTWEDSLMLALPWSWSTRNTSYSFSYRPSLVRNRDDSNLDRTDHTVMFNTTTEPGRISSFTVDARYALTEKQANVESEDSSDFFLDQRTERSLGRVETEYTRRINERWGWNTQLEARASRYEEVVIGDDPTPPTTEDKETYRVTGGVMHDLARGSKLGMQLSFSHHTQESGGEDVVDLGLSWDRQFSETLSMTAELGAFTRHLSASRQSGVVLDCSLIKQFRSSRLALQARHEPSEGGSFEGTSTNTMLRVGLYSSGTKTWNWGVSTRFVDRDPTEESQPTVQSLGLYAELERTLGRTFSTRLAGNYLDQQVKFPGVPSTNYHTASLQLVWHPRGIKQ